MPLYILSSQPLDSRLRGSDGGLGYVIPAEAGIQVAAIGQVGKEGVIPAEAGIQYWKLGDKKVAIFN
ncbi:MAG: hypothetical protein KQH63_21815 [Desulfobulbaceae bacterium]|nr:hypothetical protein [Desulfobulbaceae bacterium]